MKGEFHLWPTYKSAEEGENSPDLLGDIALWTGEYKSGYSPISLSGK